jgi:hypothetical protein
LKTNAIGLQIRINNAQRHGDIAAGTSSAEGSEDGEKLLEQHHMSDLWRLECSQKTVSCGNYAGAP